MIVARVSASGFEVLTTEKVMVRLGTGGEDLLTSEAMDRGIAALRKMKEIAEVYGASIRAVATSAVREAKNADDFLDRVRDQTSIDVQVISGGEEARLIFLGVSNCLTLGSESVLMIDIGGGSTEFSLSKDGHLNFAQSLKLGAVRLTDRFLPDGVLTENATKRLASHVSSKFSMISHDLRDAGATRVILSSGTCETLSQMIALRRTGSIPQTMNGFRFSSDELRLVIAEILDCSTTKSRAELTGMDVKRSDIIAAGALILRELVNALDIEQFEYSDFSLREGVLFDSISAIFGPGASNLDTSLDSVIRLARRCSVDITHAAHTAELGRQIFVGLQSHFEIDTDIERILIAAAYLSNTGAAISYSKYHLHSYYIVRNADLLGFTDAEIEMIALIARYHRKSAPKTSHPEFASLSDDQQEDVELLAGILRVAAAFDRSYDRAIAFVDVSMEESQQATTAKPQDEGENTVVLTVSVAPGAKAQSARLNLDTARDRTSLLEVALGCDVRIN